MKNESELLEIGTNESQSTTEYDSTTRTATKFLSVLKGRSASVPNVKTAETDEEPKAVVEQLITTHKELYKKEEECEWLKGENLKLINLLKSENEKSIFKKVFSSRKTVDTGEQVKLLKQRILKLEEELESYKIFKERLDDIVKERIQLKLDFHQKSEAQNEIITDLEEKVASREEKLNVERKLRQQRETEISHIRGYLSKKEKYYKDQIQKRDAKIKEMEMKHAREIETLDVIERNKEETVETVLRTSQNGDAGTDRLLSLLEIKTNRVLEIQEQLNNKNKYLEDYTIKIEIIKNEATEKLENAKQQILETINQLDLLKQQ